MPENYGLQVAEAQKQKNLTYDQRLENEIKRYQNKINVHDLPNIAHYWSSRYLSIYIKTLGYKSIRDIYLQHCIQACQSQTLACFCSIGSGNCDAEVQLVSQLVKAGYNNFVFECIDINQKMLNRELEKARKQSIDSYIQFRAIDLNSWNSQDHYDVVFALQCLHHFVELEMITQKICNSLNDSGYFITHDMIGRNGHQRWFETLEVIKSFWQNLPPKYRFNHRSQKIEADFINRDFSQHNFEGIRAQDILPLLQKTFKFETFVFWGGVIDPFISRAFGHNYDPTKVEDIAIIDQVQKVNEDMLIAKTIKPTQIVATMKKSAPLRKFFLYGLTPAECICHP